MKRGEVSLAKIEVIHLLELVAVPENENSPLVSKLQTARQTESQQNVFELSEEEVELMLDSLEPPGVTDVADSARSKLTEFLQHLHSN